MARGEIAINEEVCLRCGYCAHFCPNKCILISDRFNAQGFLTPVFSQPEKCTACGICGMMCPHYCIDVYKTAGRQSKAR